MNRELEPINKPRQLTPNTDERAADGPGQAALAEIGHTDAAHPGVVERLAAVAVVLSHDPTGGGAIDSTHEASRGRVSAEGNEGTQLMAVIERTWTAEQRAYLESVGDKAVKALPPHERKRIGEIIRSAAVDEAERRLEIARNDSEALTRMLDEKDRLAEEG